MGVPTAAVRLGLFCCLLVAGLGLFGYHLVLQHKCDMDANLRDLLLYTTAQFRALKIDFWLDYGTLLGIERDRKIVPWEFDNDMGTLEPNCDLVLGLRQKFKDEMGYTMYGRGEWIAQKAAWGFGGTITMPCVRVYHSDPSYSLDLYWYRPESAARVRDSSEGAIYPPPNYNPDTDGDMLCNHEGYTNELPGGCRLRRDMYPLREVEMYGHSFPVPQNPPKLLAEMYGADWQTPRPKGYKALLCPPVWRTGNGDTYLLMLAVAAAGALALGFELYKRYFAALNAHAYAPVPGGAGASGGSGGAVAAGLAAAEAQVGSVWLCPLRPCTSCAGACCGDASCFARLLGALFVWFAGSAAVVAVPRTTADGAHTAVEVADADAVELQHRRA